jgi:hypothetical protein
MAKSLRALLSSRNSDVRVTDDINRSDVAFTGTERVNVIFIIHSASTWYCSSDRSFRLPKCEVSFLYYRFKVRVSKCLSCFI